jgi:hypothetical protein
VSRQYTTDPAEAVDDHVHEFFAGHDIETLTWDTGPLYQRVPGFRVHAVGPGPRGSNAWTYVTTGCWQARHQDGHGLEFVLATREFTMRAVELLARNAYFHAGPQAQRLGLGHTVDLGEPWLPTGSRQSGSTSPIRTVPRWSDRCSDAPHDTGVPPQQGPDRLTLARGNSPGQPAPTA